MLVILGLFFLSILSQKEVLKKEPRKTKMSQHKNKTKNQTGKENRIGHLYPLTISRNKANETISLVFLFHFTRWFIVRKLHFLKRCFFVESLGANRLNSKPRKNSQSGTHQKCINKRLT